MAKENSWGLHVEQFPQQELRHLPVLVKVLQRLRLNFPNFASQTRMRHGAVFLLEVATLMTLLT